LNFLQSYALSNRCLDTMIFAFAFALLLGVSAVLTISDLGTHCFMGPLGLVLEVLLFTSYTLRCGFGSFGLTITLGLTPFGFDSLEAATVLFF